MRLECNPRFAKLDLVDFKHFTWRSPQHMRIPLTWKIPMTCRDRRETQDQTCAMTASSFRGPCDGKTSSNVSYIWAFDNFNMCVSISIRRIEHEPRTNTRFQAFVFISTLDDVFQMAT